MTIGARLAPRPIGGPAACPGNGELPSCSYCCAGEASYHYDIGSDKPPQNVSIHFDPDKIRDMSDQTHVDCFLKLLQTDPNVKDNTILKARADAFLQDFVTTCEK